MSFFLKVVLLVIALFFSVILTEVFYRDKVEGSVWGRVKNFASVVLDISCSDDSEAEKSFFEKYIFKKNKKIGLYNIELGGDEMRSYLVKLKVRYLDVHLLGLVLSEKDKEEIGKRVSSLLNSADNNGKFFLLRRHYRVINNLVVMNDEVFIDIIVKSGEVLISGNLHNKDLIDHVNKTYNKFVDLNDRKMNIVSKIVDMDSMLYENVNFDNEVFANKLSEWNDVAKDLIAHGFEGKVRICWQGAYFKGRIPSGISKTKINKIVKCKYNNGHSEYVLDLIDDKDIVFSLNLRQLDDSIILSGSLGTAGLKDELISAVKKTRPRANFIPDLEVVNKLKSREPETEKVVKIVEEYLKNAKDGSLIIRDGMVSVSGFTKTMEEKDSINILAKELVGENGSVKNILGVDKNKSSGGIKIFKKLKEIATPLLENKKPVVAEPKIEKEPDDKNPVVAEPKIEKEPDDKKLVPNNEPKATKKIIRQPKATENKKNTIVFDLNSSEILEKDENDLLSYLQNKKEELKADKYKITITCLKGEEEDADLYKWLTKMRIKDVKTLLSKANLDIENIYVKINQLPPTEKFTNSILTIEIK